MLASGEESETVRDALAQLDAAMFGHDFDLRDAAYWDADEPEEDEDDWESLEEQRLIPPVLAEDLRSFLLTLPLVELPADLSGACRLGVWMPHGGRPMPGARLGMGGGAHLAEALIEGLHELLFGEVP